MRTQRQFIDEYRLTHSNPTNALVHTICVPIIIFASLGMLWTLPLGRWLGVGAPYAGWVNGATVVGLLNGALTPASSDAIVTAGV